MGFAALNPSYVLGLFVPGFDVHHQHVDASSKQFVDYHLPQVLALEDTYLLG